MVATWPPPGGWPGRLTHRLGVSMSAESDLLLPDLTIRRFLGFDDLVIPRLGRVSLLTGANGVGKTTILDAIRVYASRGHPSDLTEILTRREEQYVERNEEGRIIPVFDWAALFHGRDLSEPIYARVGSGSSNLELSFEPEYQIERDQHLNRRFFMSDDLVPVIRVQFEGTESILYLDPDLKRRHSQKRNSATLICHTLGPGIQSSLELASFWDTVALTDDEQLVIDALNLVADGMVDKVRFVGNPGLRPSSTYRGRSPSGGRHAIARLRDHDDRVPLKSLGDGVWRLFGVALALANCRDGILLIDEAENGIHHRIQTGLWQMVLQTAVRNNVQVIATTHSWDCIRGFAQASIESPVVEGVLIRVARRAGEHGAIEYTEDELATVIEHNIEVR